MNKDVLDTLRDYKDKCKELENINDKLSNSLLSAENKIDKYKEVINKANKLIDKCIFPAYDEQSNDFQESLYKIKEVLKEAE